MVKKKKINKKKSFLKRKDPRCFGTVTEVLKCCSPPPHSRGRFLFRFRTRVSSALVSVRVCWGAKINRTDDALNESPCTRNITLYCCNNTHMHTHFTSTLRSKNTYNLCLYTEVHSSPYSNMRVFALINNNNTPTGPFAPPFPGRPSNRSAAWTRYEIASDGQTARVFRRKLHTHTHTNTRALVHRFTQTHTTVWIIIAPEMIPVLHIITRAGPYVRENERSFIFFWKLFSACFGHVVSSDLKLLNLLRFSEQTLYACLINPVIGRPPSVIVDADEQDEA